MTKVILKLDDQLMVERVVKLLNDNGLGSFLTLTEVEEEPKKGTFKYIKKILQENSSKDMFKDIDAIQLENDLRNEWS